MNEIVKQSIDARKNAIFAAYQVNDEEKKKVEALFSEIEKLGAECKDAGDFEAKFAASPLNQKYLDLFTEIATSSASGTAASAADDTTASIAGGMAEGAAEEVARMAVRTATGGAVPTTRAAAHQKVYDAARDIPVVGDAINIGQKAGYAMHLGKLFRKKDKENED